MHAEILRVICCVQLNCSALREGIPGKGLVLLLVLGQLFQAMPERRSGIPRKCTGQEWATDIPAWSLTAGSLPVFCALGAAAGWGWFGASWLSGHNLKMEMC